MLIYYESKWNIKGNFGEELCFVSREKRNSSFIGYAAFILSILVGIASIVGNVLQYTRNDELRIGLRIIEGTLEERNYQDEQNLNQISEYQNQIMLLEDEINSLNNSIEEQNSTNQQNRIQIREYQNRISNLENEITNLNAEIDIFVARGEPSIIRNLDGNLPTIVSLRNVTSIQDNFRDSHERRDNYRNEHTDVLWMGANGNSGNFRALLDSRYTRLRGVVFVAYGNSSGGETTLRLELDGRVIESHTLNRSTRPISIDIDLSGGNEFAMILRSTLAGGGWVNGPAVHFADFLLYP